MANRTPDPSPLHGADLCAFLVTTDPARCREFFVGKLGLRVAAEDDFALVLDAHGRSIRVQKAQQHEPRPYTVLGWNVADHDAVRRRMVAAGVTFEQFGLPMQDADGVATFPGGARVAWFKDPDGNVLSIAQAGC